MDPEANAALFSVDETNRLPPGDQEHRSYWDLACPAKLQFKKNMLPFDPDYDRVNATEDNSAPEINDRRKKAMKTNLPLAIVLGIILMSCASPAPDVVSRRDLSGGKADLLSFNYLETTPPSDPLIRLDASRLTFRNSEVRCYLEVRSESRVGYLDIPPGETLKLIIDGQVREFRGAGSSGVRQLKNGVYYEAAIYETSEYVLHWISQAEQVRVQIQGQNAAVQRDFGPANFERYREFATNYLTQ